MGTYDRHDGSPHSPDIPDFSSDLRDNILSEVESERDYQCERWGSSADDTKNSPNDWVAYIAHHSTRWFVGGFAPYSAETVVAFRQQMVKVAALAVAAIESLDRQVDNKGAPFYQSAKEKQQNDGGKGDDRT